MTEQEMNALRRGRMISQILREMAFLLFLFAGSATLPAVIIIAESPEGGAPGKAVFGLAIGLSLAGAGLLALVARRMTEWAAGLTLRRSGHL